MRTCCGCEESFPQPLPDDITGAEIEAVLQCGHVADVLLQAGSRARAAVEIRVTHPVDAEKARTLSVPFIELTAEDILDDPRTWKPVSARVKSHVCTRCENLRQAFEWRAQAMARAAGFELPPPPYRYGFVRCFKCRRETLVFTWPGKLVHGGAVPPDPRPRTLRFLRSKPADTRYWMNTCARCGAPQGDFFLYSEPDGPFWGLDEVKAGAPAWRQDMLTIVSWWHDGLG